MCRPKFYFFALAFLLIPFCIQAQNFGGNPSNIKWQQINNTSSRIVFPMGLDNQARHINNLITLLDSSTAYSIGTRMRKWNVILNTQSTTSNAYVRLAPVLSEFYMMPDQNSFSSGSIRWDENLVVHEHRHMQQFSNFNTGFTKVFSFLLGQEGQLLANGLTIPDYFFEGDAVWQETLVTAQGRGRIPFFFNGIKSLWVEDKKYSWMKLRSGSYKDYTPNHYPLGYILVAYGYAVYGADFWKKVTQDAVHFKGVFYPFNKAIERYSGKSYKQYRNDAITFFKAQSFPATLANQDQPAYFTKISRNNVVDYLLPQFIGNDSILALKRSYNSLPTFCLLINGSEKKIRILNKIINDYYSYNNGKIVYASYRSDPRWANREYNDLQVIDLKTKKQTQLSFKTKYFSPDINQDGTEILAVQVNPNGTNFIHRLNANTGALIFALPNPNNYFFTQTKYLNNTMAVSAIRDPGGKMALAKINLTNGAIENLTAFTFNTIGFPFVKGDTVYFNAMNGYADNIFAVNLVTNKISRLTNNNNGTYYPSVNEKGEMMVSAFTASGYRLQKINLSKISWQEYSAGEFVQVSNLYTPEALNGRAAGALYSLDEKNKERSTRYKKSFRLFNFHSWRPIINDPEFGYSIYSDNFLSNFNNNLSYTYNRNEKSHSFGFNGIFAGWFPVINLGTEMSLNRNINVLQQVTDTSSIVRSIAFNSAKVNAGILIPLRYIGGRTNKFLSVGIGYNIEQLYYNGIGKEIFKNTALHYTNASLSFSNVNQQAKQHVNPRWAQSISATYRYAFNYRDSRKFVANSAFFFPGFAKNHSIVFQGSIQKRDSLPDLFSNTFSYARGYAALSTRRMFKLAGNYQLPVLYPDLGVGNIIFFQRIRVNAFFDYCDAYARLNGKLTNIINRSAGTEIYVDTKLWNALPFTFVIRYSHLLDTDLRNPGAKNKWEFTIPIGFIPD